MTRFLSKSGHRTPEAHELARQIGEETLEGVGDRGTLFSTETDEYVLHRYLALTEEVQEMLPPVRYTHQPRQVRTIASYHENSQGASNYVDNPF